MLLPFEFGIITIEDASLLKTFIEKQTATKAYPVNYKKMQEEGVMNIYEKLIDFIYSHEHYLGKLKYYPD